MRPLCQATSVHKSYPRSLGWASTLQLNSLKVKTKFAGGDLVVFLAESCCYRDHVSSLAWQGPPGSGRCQGRCHSEEEAAPPTASSFPRGLSIHHIFLA